MNQAHKEFQTQKELEELKRQLDQLKIEQQKFKLFIKETLQLQTQLVYSLKDSIIRIIAFLPFIKDIVEQEMEKQIRLVNDYTKNMTYLFDKQ